jgi:hypothetical protein
MLLKAGGVATMAAKSPLLAGGALVAAGGLAANCCNKTASTIWFATKSTIRLSLSPTAPCAPPGPTALGLIGPKKKGLKNWF